MATNTIDSGWCCRRNGRPLIEHTFFVTIFCVLSFLKKPLQFDVGWSLLCIWVNTLIISVTYNCEKASTPPVRWRQSITASLFVFNFWTDCQFLKLFQSCSPFSHFHSGLWANLETVQTASEHWSNMKKSSLNHMLFILLSHLAVRICTCQVCSDFRAECSWTLRGQNYMSTRGSEIMRWDEAVMCLYSKTWHIYIRPDLRLKHGTVLVKSWWIDLIDYLYYFK